MSSPNNISRPSCLIDNYQLIVATSINTSSCPNGFFCPNLTEGNPSTYPSICPPTIECQTRRLLGEFCEPQGYFEPIVCPRGSFCQTPKSIRTCPPGYYCPFGTTNPKKCGLFSYCPEGSKVKTEYLGLILAGVLDLLLIAFYFYYKYKQRYNAAINHVDDALPKPVETPADILFRTLSFRGRANQGRKIRNGFKEQGIIDAFRKSLDDQNISINLKFQDMSLTLPSGVTILDGVTGEIAPGKFTAILGPSGAGKTTFLNVLLGKVSRTKGELFINEAVSDLSQFKQLIGYVPQEDIMLKELTVRENLMHACRIRAPTNWTDSEIECFVDALIRALSLENVAHSLIGDEHVRGISGGQRKRVNIGIELAGLPISMFLDEPTSGLDSTAALNVAKILKDMANLGLNTVAVIHQPRSEIFYQLDDILLLIPGGRTAYLGPREHIVEYFQNLGYQVKPASGFQFLKAQDLAEEWEFFKQYGCHRHQSINRNTDIGEYSYPNSADLIYGNNKTDTLSSKNSRFSFDEKDYLEQELAFQERTIDRIPDRPPRVPSKPGFLNRDPLTKQPTIKGKSVIPGLHRTLTRTMSFKVPSTPKVQQASQEQLLQVCSHRGAGFGKQFVLCLKRSVIQQYRHFLSLIWEIGVASLTGFLVGLAMLQSHGLLYRGIVVEPFVSISAAPLETYILQTGLIFGMAICIAAAPSGCNVFGSETLNYYREASSGHSRLAYYLAKFLAALPRIILAALHMTAVWYPMATPLISFEKIFCVFLLQFYGIYGLASIISLLFQRKGNQAVWATLAGFFPAAFCGYGPTLNDARQGHYEFLMALSYTRWGNEAFYSEELTPYRGIFQVDPKPGAVSIGYTFDRVGLDFLFMFLLGSMLWTLCYFVLINFNRAKQR